MLLAKTSSNNSNNSNNNERLRKLNYCDTVFFVVNLSLFIKKSFSIHYIAALKILPHLLQQALVSRKPRLMIGTALFCTLSKISALPPP